ncbi:MAG: CPBP family intramembrane glutamic endopeptidase [Planctomycetota bacterium]
MGGIVALASGSVAAPALGQSEPADAGIPIVALGIAMLVSAVCLAILWKVDAIRPGSIKRAGHDSPEPRAAIPLALLAFGVFLLPAVFTAIALALLRVSFEGEPTLRDNGVISALTHGSGVALSIAVCWFAAKWKLLKSENLRPRVRDLWVGVLALVLAYPLMHLTSLAASAVYTLSGGQPDSPLQHGTLELLATGDRASVWWWAIVAGAVLGAPIVEEVVFRGLLQPAIRAMAGPWAAIMIAGALFTLLHVPRSPDSGGATWLAIPTLAVLAIALGIARERSGRLGVPIVMHIAFNALNVALALTLSK